MPSTLLQRVWFGCYHQFSWPRRSEEGVYYQVCLRCGARYAYNWRLMRRTARLDQEEPAADARKPVRTSRWSPRERRLRVEGPVKFRPREGAREWRLGLARNLSRSGLLFAIDDEPPALGSELEVIVELPPELCGSEAAPALCQARVVRVTDARRGHPALLAVAILECEFRPGIRPAGASDTATQRGA